MKFNTSSKIAELTKFSTFNSFWFTVYSRRWE